MATRLILASASPRRQELLRFMRVPFTVIPANVDELDDTDQDPEHLVLHNAQLKAEAILENHPNAPVLAADTTVALDGEILNKPKDLNDARSMLRRLSGRSHSVYTGICLRYKPLDLDINHCEISQVRFLDLTDSTIDEYHSVMNPLDKAGAYGIQEHPELIIAGYTGHMSNIIGLPIEFLYSLFRKYPLLSKE